MGVDSIKLPPYLVRIVHQISSHQRQHGGGEGAREQEQRAVEDRLAVHAHLHRDRPAVEAIGEVLFPPEDVAAVDAGRLVLLEIARVVFEDAAGQMQPEGDDLAAVPADVLERAGLQRGGADGLPEQVLAVLRR